MLHNLMPKVEEFEAMLQTINANIVTLNKKIEHLHNTNTLQHQQIMTAIGTEKEMILDAIQERPPRKCEKVQGIPERTTSAKAGNKTKAASKKCKKEDNKGTT